LTVPVDARAEFISTNSRGKTGVGLGLSKKFRQYFVILFAWVILGRMGYANDSSTLYAWKIMVCVAAIPTVLALAVGKWTVPESHRWLLFQGRHDEAVHIPRQVAERNGKDALKLFPAKCSIDGRPRTRNKRCTRILQTDVSYGHLVHFCHSGG
jgi:hypothetical protein